MMDPFFIFLFTSFLMFIFLIFLSFWVPWKANQRNDMPKFCFDTFKHFYMLNPEKWELQEDSVVYKGKGIEIEFEKYRDVIKYHSFKKDLRKNEERREKEKRERELWDEMRELEEMDMEEEDINIFYSPYL